MRRIWRTPLPADASEYLETRKRQIAKAIREGETTLTQKWDSARQTEKIALVFRQLQQMAGSLERCMYCLNPEGTDIEHFWPKSCYPRRMFNWRNLLLCCTKCGRLKGNRFPRAGNKPLLIDPSKENPWEYLEFEPLTGVLTARFDLQTNSFFAKGHETVKLFQLDQREVPAKQHLRTWKRINQQLIQFLDSPTSTAELVANLIELDEHDLLSWVFIGNGNDQKLFCQLRHEQAEAWLALKNAVLQLVKRGQ